ncbi:hypothetical protein [Epilithonimonas sp.]|uniref:hypothetical protein n=1 Tax=Epilithonimonas sp. TaxID=2894511 RepID=UPI0035B229E0
MKKLYIAFSLFLASLAYSQVPQAFSYQTIAFNSAGAPIANGNVNLRISILDNSATGTVLYTETHTKTTNSKGLVNLNIGQGTVTTGNFGGINWGTNPKFVKVEMDPAGGSNYTNVGVNQLMSVPYALVAGNISTQQNINNVVVSNNKNNFGNGCIVVYSDTEAKGYYLNPNGTNSGYWSGTNVTFSSPIKGTVASNNTIVVYSDTEAKGYYLNPNGTNSGYWSGTNVNFSSPIKGAIASNNTVVVYSDTEAKGYYLNPNTTNSGYWSGTNVTFSSSIKGAIASNNTIVVYSDTEAKGYYLNPNGTNSGYWSGTNVTFSSPIKGGFSSGGSIVIYSDTEAKGYYLNSNTTNSGYWSGTNVTFSSPIKGGISTAQ